jgi:outer membrane biosynthesis protein TonB
MLDSFLDWFERHKYGVVGTLMLHTLLLFILNVSSVGDRNPPPPPEPLALDMELALPPPPEPEPARQQEQVPAGAVTNRASNTTAEIAPEQRMSRAAQERMSQQVDRELHEMEQQEFDRLAAQRTAEGKDIVVPKLDTSKFNKRNYMDKGAAPKPVKVKGLTTVSYDLVGRSDIVLEVPAYLCKGQGKVVVRVAVDRTGAVTKAELDGGASTTTDPCMVDNALASAGSAKFSYAPTAPQPQRGSITYIFLAQ